MRKYYKIFNPNLYRWLFGTLIHGNSKVFSAHLQRLILGYRRYYNHWLKNVYPTTEELEEQKNYKFKYSPKISIVVPTYNTPQQFLDDMYKSVKNQTYKNWELCIADGSDNNNVENFFKEKTNVKYKKLKENKGIADNTNEAIKLATGEYISFLDHDDIIECHTLFEIVKSLQNVQHDLIYTDEDFATTNLSCYHDPFFKPDWSPDLLMSHNYITHFVTVKKAIVDKVKGIRSEFDGAQDYDFLFRCTEISDSIYHIPQVLYHWRENDTSVASDSSNKMYAFEAGKNALQSHLDRMKISGQAEMTDNLGYYKVIYNTPGNPLVSIIIPNKDHTDDLKKCIDSLYKVNIYKNIEILIAENNSEEKETFSYYEYLENKFDNLKVLKYQAEFNFAKINNFAAKKAKGQYILFLNNDTEMIDPHSLEQMLGNCMRADVGIVGAKLLFGDDTLQHVGVVLGFGGFAGHVFSEQKQDARGYMFRPQINCNYSAVTGACLLIKKSIFDDVDGFNEDFKVGLNDIDLCLKVRHKNYLVVYNANTLWHHYESKSRGYDESGEKKKRLESEVKRFQKIWTEDLSKPDPYYSPNFSTEYIPYEMFEIEF